MNFDKIQNNTDLFAHTLVVQEFADELIKRLILEFHTVKGEPEIRISGLSLYISFQTYTEHLTYHIEFSNPREVLSFEICRETPNKQKHLSYIHHFLFIEICSKYFDVSNYKNSIWFDFIDAESIRIIKNYRKYLENYTSSVYIKVLTNFRNAMFDDTHASCLINSIDCVYNYVPDVHVCFLEDYSLNEMIHASVMDLHMSSSVVYYWLHYQNCKGGLVDYKVEKAENEF